MLPLKTDMRYVHACLTLDSLTKVIRVGCKFLMDDEWNSDCLKVFRCVLKEKAKLVFCFLRNFLRRRHELSHHLMASVLLKDQIFCRIFQRTAANQRPNFYQIDDASRVAMDTPALLVCYKRAALIGSRHHSKDLMDISVNCHWLEKPLPINQFY